MLPLILSIFVGVLGLITGSFLNAVIHRLPRGISLMNPKRSICPCCGKMIPWHENLPVASWLLLRGRCSGCSLPIAIRYPLVELLTAALYLMAWSRFGLPLAPVFWIFLSLLIAATFIDFDYLIIPDEITLGGTGAGMLAATLIPRLLEATSWWQGFLFSLVGAAAGYFILWGVVELGKLAFGKRRIRSEKSILLSLSEQEERIVLKLEEEMMPLNEAFYRESDRIEAVCLWIEVSGERLESGLLVVAPDRVTYKEHEKLSGKREWLFTDLPDDALCAEVSELILPREAMGFGDVKFLACIGAFLGWKGVLFSLFAGSVMGAVVGVAMLLVTHGRSGGKIPFGPYLALGALLWVFAGPQLLDLYLTPIRGEAFFLSSLLPLV